MARVKHKPLTVPEFRELGFQVYVKHIRRWRFVVDHPTREEFLTLRQAGENGMGDGELVPGRWLLESKGGRTIAVIQRQGQAQVLATGSAVTSVVDDYVKRTGLVKALGRAQAQLERKGLLPGV